MLLFNFLDNSAVLSAFSQQAKCSLFAVTGSVLVVTAELVYLLGGKTYLADDIALGLGEAVEEMIAVAEGDHVAYLIEIKVGV